MLKFIFVLLFASLSFAASLDRPVTVVVLGDSLTEGYGILKTEAYPQLVQDKFRKDGMTGVKILNAGISGSTSAGAADRLKWFLKSKPEFLVLELGANDGLRGLPNAGTKNNLLKAVRLAKENKVNVILVGMMLPPNYGAEYTTGFRSMYADIARSEKIDLVPFLLEGVAGDVKLNQEDGLHPNSKGHAILADNVYKVLKPIVQNWLKK